MKRSYKSEFSDLRQKAEELLITKISKSDSPLSENDTLKLIHELEVHQIELELQNKELNLARSAALLTAEKFTELYDFSPTSYFSLSKDGRIVELNLEGAKMLGKERSLFIDKVFGLFVSSDTKQRFGLFLKQVFTSNAKETCEVTLLTGDGTQMVVLLTGIPTENGKQCLLSVVDITERKRLDSIIKTRNSILELSYHCSLDELLQKTLDAVEILSQSKISFFHFVEEDQVTLSLQTWSTNTLQKMCSADGKDQHYPIDQAGVWVDCIAARSPVIHNDYLSLPHRKGLPVGHAPVIRELVVPILRNEKVAAILGVGNKERDYDQTDVQSITEIADIVWDIAERKKGEEALRESNEFNQSLLQTIPFGMDIVDEFGNILYLSEKIKQHFGDDSLGKKCWDLYRDDKKQCSDCPLHSGINVGETKAYETNGVLGGKTFEIYHTGMIFNGQKAMLEAFIDITERRHTEQLLEKSEEKYRTIFENVQDVFYQTDLNGIVLEISPSIKHFSEFNREEMIGFPVSNLYHNPDDREVLLKAIKITGELRDYELMLKTKTGNVKYVSINASLISDPDGKPMHIDGAIRDITERKWAEEAMRTWNARFKKLSENAPGLIYQFTRRPDGTYFVPLASEGIKDIFGCSPEDVIDDFAPIGRVVYPGDLARVISDIEYSAEHLSYFTSEFRVQIPGREIQWIYSKSTPEKLPDGSITWYGFNTDITERIQKEKEILDLNSNLELRVKQRTLELEAAIKELETFSYSISHDLKAPLRHITGFIGLFLENKSKELSKEDLGYLEVISSSASEMGKLVDGILNFSKLNAIELQKTRIRSSEIVQQVIKFFDPEIQNRKITFQVETLPEVKADEELIRQVWINLISNAIKYTMKKPEAVIEIGSSSTDNEITFYIKDNGAGFNMKYAEKLFGVFQRLHKTSDFEGVGIGLANVNRIVTRHGGHCRAEGDVDKGATFYFSLPK